MGDPSGLYREFEESLLLATITDMACRFSTGKQCSNLALRISVPRPSVYPSVS